MAASANPRIGLRRVKRAHSVARALQDFASCVQFLDLPLPGRLRHSIQQSGIQLIAGAASQNVTGSEFGSLDPFAFQAILDQQQPDWFIADGFALDASVRKIFESRDVRVAEIDAVNLHEGEYSGTTAVSLKIAPWDRREYFNAPNAELLSGPDFVPLATSYNETLSRQIPTRMKRIVIWIEDVASAIIYEPLLAAISQVQLPYCSVDLFLPPGVSHDEQLMQVARDCSRSVRIHSQAGRGPGLLQQADLAIVGPGTVFMEAASLGVPMMLVDDAAYAPAWLDPDQAPCVFVDADSDVVTIAKQLRVVARGKELREKMAEAGRALVDGNGARRIARSAAVYDFDFRRVCMDDARVLHDWRNDPETRAMSFDGGPISFEQHAHWMQEVTCAGREDVFMIEDQHRQAIGTWQLEFDSESRVADMSLLLVPGMRGRGLGTALIEKACRSVSRIRSVAEFTAHIRPKHPMAQAAFTNAGFEATGPVQINGELATRFHYRPRTIIPIEQQSQRRKAS